MMIEVYSIQEMVSFIIAVAWVDLGTWV